MPIKIINLADISILSNLFQDIMQLYSYYKIADRKETFLKMINASSGWQRTIPKVCNRFR